ncbi:unnamed protein product, partial [Candidula unifasciata]
EGSIPPLPGCLPRPVSKKCLEIPLVSVHVLGGACHWPPVFAWASYSYYY